MAPIPASFGVRREIERFRREIERCEQKPETRNPLPFFFFITLKPTVE